MLFIKNHSKRIDINKLFTKTLFVALGLAKSAFRVADRFGRARAALPRAELARLNQIGPFASADLAH
jgi:hypothetical protein